MHRVVKSGRLEEFLVQAGVLRERLGVSKVCWSNYKRDGKIKIISLFGRDYVSAEECNRILREGTGTAAALAIARPARKATG